MTNINTPNMFQLSEDRKKLIRLNGNQHSYVVVPSGVEEICDEAFSRRSALKIIKLPESLQKIGERAFKNCTSLERIDIPNNVKEIGNFAFSKCSNLKIAILPSNLTTFWSNIFSDCSTLQILSIKNRLENLTISSFAAIKADCTFIVPTEHLEYYQNTIDQLKQESLTMQHKHFIVSDDHSLICRTWGECFEEWIEIKKFNNIEQNRIPWGSEIPFGIQLTIKEYNKFKNEQRSLSEIAGWCESGEAMYNHICQHTRMNKTLPAPRRVPRIGYYKIVEIIKHETGCTYKCYYNYNNPDEFVEETIEIDAKRINLMCMKVGNTFQVTHAILKTNKFRTFYEIESIFIR